jgi:hypothetical protein
MENEYDKEHEYNADYEFDLKLRNVSENRHDYIDLLDMVCTNEQLLMTLIKTLLEESDEKFIELCNELKVNIVDRDDFLFWLSFKEYFGNVTESSCANRFDDIIEILKKAGRNEEILKLISGDESTFNKVKSEFSVLRDDIFATYDWFYDNYIEKYYNIRYILKANGVVFPDYE